MSEANADEVARLEANVQNRLSRRVRGLRLAVRGCGLILQGQAPNYYAKQLAQQAVMEACALPILANEIEVT